MCTFFAKRCLEKLPPLFWIVAVKRALFVVVFKYFTQNSNLFLMVRASGPLEAVLFSATITFPR